MHFLESIIGHYIRESHQGFGAALFGGIVLIAAVFLFRIAPPLSLAKGLTIPALLVGLVMGLGGLGDGYSALRAIPGKAGLFRKDPKAFFDQEMPQVEKTHRSWRRIRITWGIFTVLGAALLFIVRKDYWMGVALGMITLSIAGHIEEAISKNFNEQYYQQVLAESKAYAHDAGKQQAAAFPTGSVKNLIHHKKKRSFFGDTIQPKRPIVETSDTSQMAICHSLAELMPPLGQARDSTSKILIEDRYPTPIQTHRKACRCWIFSGKN